MKDLAQYSYSELYDMLNHINPYKYQDRVNAVRLEIEKRKQAGEIPDRIIPRATASREDYIHFFKMLGSVSYILFVLALGYVFLNSLLKNGLFNDAKDYFFAGNIAVLVAGLIMDFFLKNKGQLRVVLLVYLSSSVIAFGVAFGSEAFHLAF